jgi:tetratricopeptide (TPR) repeat protein
MAHVAASWLHLLQGDWVRAAALVEQGIAAYRSGTILLNLPHAVASAAWALAQAGERDLALTRLREGERMLEREATQGIIGLHAEACHALGRAALLLDRPDDARRLGETALAYAPAHPGFKAHAWYLLADVAARPEGLDAERAESAYRRALELAEARAMRPLIAHCHLGLGRLARSARRALEAKEHLATASAMYRAMEMEYWSGRAEEETGRAASLL